LNKIEKKYEKKISEISQIRKMESLAEFEGKSNLEEIFMSSINSFLNYTKLNNKRYEYLSEENEFRKSTTLLEISQSLIGKQSKLSDLMNTSRFKFTESSNMMTVDFDLSRSITNLKLSLTRSPSGNNSDLMISNPQIFDPEATNNHTGLSFGSSVISKDLDMNSFHSNDNINDTGKNINESIDMSNFNESKTGLNRKGSNVNLNESKQNVSPGNTFRNLSRPKKR
jgi:hypothetical protein